ncbi:MAG: protein kinase domain-containing protein [Thermomicrobiales bacterium]
MTNLPTEPTDVHVVQAAAAGDGDLLAQYEVLALVGEGPRARVFRARDQVLDLIVAVKLLHPEYGGDDELVACLYHAARLASSLGQPGIVAAYDYGPHPEGAFLTLEYVAGADLAALLRQRGPLPPRQAVALIVQALDALSAAHARGFAHGDLHPHNLLVRADGGAVRLTDFGMDQAALPDGEIAASRQSYRAPERRQGGAATPAADVYAVGAILYELLTGQPVAVDGPPALAGLSHVMAKILRQALAVDPAARYPDAAALRAPLAAAIGHVAAPARPAMWNGALEQAVRQTSIRPQQPNGAVQPTRRVWRLPRPRPAQALAAGAVVLLLAASGATGLALANHMQALEQARATEAALALPGATETLTTVPVLAAVLPTATEEPLPTATTVPAAATSVRLTPTTAPPTATRPAATATSVPPTTVPTAVPTAAPTTPPTEAPPTAAGGGVGVVLDDFTPDQLNGSYQRLAGRLYGRPEVALYGVNSGYSTGTLTFTLATAPTGQVKLVLTGLDDEWQANCPLAVVINDVTVFSGANTFPNTPASDHGLGGDDRYWGQMQIVVPAGLLQAGANSLTLRNLADGDTVGTPPYILINGLELVSEH